MATATTTNMSTTRYDMIERIGKAYFTSNIENGEYSYVKEAGSKESLKSILGHSFSHHKLDIRFEMDDVVLLVETKGSFKKTNEAQLAEYVEEEKKLHNNNKIVAILANTKNSKIKVWKSIVDDKHVLTNETVLDTMEHYASLFKINKQNDREKVLKNTYDLNELLYKMDIDEKLRSQFVGTTLLYLKSLLDKFGARKIDEDLKDTLHSLWSMMDGKQLRAAIESTL